jgi:hypothetical protein
LFSVLLTVVPVPKSILKLSANVINGFIAAAGATAGASSDSSSDFPSGAPSGSFLSNF